MLGRETELGARLECMAGLSGRADSRSEIEAGGIAWRCEREARRAFMLIGEASREMAGGASASDGTGVSGSVRLSARLFPSRFFAKLGNQMRR